MPRNQIDVLVQSFLDVVIAENLHTSLPEITRGITEINQKTNGKKKAIVWTRKPLTPDLLEKIGEVLSLKVGKTLEVENKIDDSLIGGFKIEYGDWVYNATVKKSFENIHKLLA
ncbi:F0F1 ATP synthase subunit delta [Candidatus Microgenomates bacterium]|nr:F0F1 ATP synthase subunit delta [Candidatus Microgenomates bacterium]